jgi:hypothetical protein
MTDDLERELGQLVASHELATKLVEVLHREVMEPARDLFGDRATAWVASTLRTTAAVLERLDPCGHPPV